MRIDQHGSTHRRAAATIAAGGLALALAVVATPAAAATVCNGHAELCDRRYDEVTYAATHNSFATYDDGYSVVHGNHYNSVAKQLADGIRGLNFDTYLYGGVVTLCHGGVDLCPLASKSLADELAVVKAFLDANPGEVITIDFQDGVSADDTAAVFEEVGLWDPASPSTDDLYAHPGGDWPTLGELVDSGERVVVFTKKTTTIPWLHPKWTLMFRTDYQAASIDDFTCDLLDGSPTNDLFMLPHFITSAVGSSPALAAQSNANPFFADRVAECGAVYGRTPNLLRVDYYEQGDLFALVDDLNGTVTPCVDLDGDGFGSPPSGQCVHAQPDCDDGAASVNPDAAEVPGNGRDDDCDPTTSSGCAARVAGGPGGSLGALPGAFPLLGLAWLRRRARSRRRAAGLASR